MQIHNPHSYYFDQDEVANWVKVMAEKITELEGENEQLAEERDEALETIKELEEQITNLKLGRELEAV